VTAGSFVYAVCLGEQRPREVLALYTNERAATQHAAMVELLSVVRWDVATEYPHPDSVAQYCVRCAHLLTRMDHEWRCDERCRCTMAGCMPRRPMPVLGDNVGYALGSVAAAGEPGSGEPMVTLVVDLDEREPSTGEQPDAEPDEPDAGEPGGDAE
jgi:hypothetical protein